MTDSDKIIFASEREQSTEKERWKVMIVDDDEGIHNITKMALRKLTFEDRALHFINAYSGNEAIRLMEENPDTALIFLDVVMEDESAGLKVVKHIREEIKNKFVRIILRTGQPGQAPEEDIVVNYDINDYKTKDELTADKLFTSVISSLRAYNDIVTIDTGRRGLKKIIESSASLFKLKSMENFVSGILEQLISILRCGNDALYCQTTGFLTGECDKELIILAGTGMYERHTGNKVENVVGSDILKDIKNACENEECLYYDNRSIVFFRSKSKLISVVYVEKCGLPDEWDRQLLEYFCSNVSAAFNNLYLNNRFNDIKDAAVKGIVRIAELNAGRPCDPANGVGKTAVEIAEKLFERGRFIQEIDEKFLHMLRSACSIYDIAKIGIPEKIIKKSESLTLEEWEALLEHSSFGNQIILEAADKVMDNNFLHMAGIIAKYHHEKFDGTGFPGGLKGNEIPLSARIVSAAVFYSTLISHRFDGEPYSKKAALQFIESKSGEHFDPEVVDALIELKR